MKIIFHDNKPKAVYKNLEKNFSNKTSFKKDFLNRLIERIQKQFRGELVKINFDSQNNFGTWITGNNDLLRLRFNDIDYLLFCGIQLEIVSGFDHINIAKVNFLHKNKLYHHYMVLAAEPIFFDNHRPFNQYKWSCEVPYDFAFISNNPK